MIYIVSFFFSSRRRHTRLQGDWSSDVCSSDLLPPVQRAQRSHIRGGNAKFLAQVAPQGDGNHPKGIRQAATHAQKPDMQRQTELVGVTPARIDCLALCTIEGEKRLHLEVTDRKSVV